jgi:hypothetical protein
MPAGSGTTPVGSGTTPAGRDAGGDARSTTGGDA